MKENELIEMGTSYRVHGLKGAFSFYLYNPQSRAFRRGLKIHLRPKSSSSKLPEHGQDFTIENVSFGPKKCTLLLEGITRIELAQEILPFAAFFPRSAFPKLKGKEFYLMDLMGLTAVNAQEQLMGTVVDYFENGVQVVLKVDLTNGERVELPFVEDFFPVVDLENGRIKLNLPEFVEADESD